MEYREVYVGESWGDHGAFGIKILISMSGASPANLTTPESVALADAAEKLQGVFMREKLRNDPTAADSARRNREEIVGLFPQPIFVEEIPNGYCSRWCCAHLPWFIVTTKVGRITAGWRKRVIQISWEPSAGETAEVLFPEEDVTKNGRLIHAWSLEKARQYVSRLLSNHTTTVDGKVT